jgi:polyketide synthase PksN
VATREDSEYALNDVIHAAGKVKWGTPRSFQETEKMDISAIKARCLQKSNPEEFYQKAESFDFHFGPSFHVLKEILHNSSEVIAYLQLPEVLLPSANSFTLHPSLLDGMLQAADAILLAGENPDKIIVPFSFAELNIFGALPPKCYVYAKSISGTKPTQVEIKILDETGNVLLHVNDYSARVLDPTSIHNF